ncbi:uncharacterized protein LOC143550032 [Bidens hawaiensis]|uniref:uncharacterized protein LOC143550032 n=1 Tax=Bidens hawaiensis TaxID=980011 RepID=UPI004049C7B2
MDVFSLLKFWRNPGVGDSIDDDDEGSFYDLVFSTHNDPPQVNIITSGFHDTHYQQPDEDSKSNHSSPHTNNSKRKLLPLDSSNTNTKTTPRSPFRVLMLGLHTTKSKSVKEMQEVVTISSLLKRDKSDQMQSKRFSKDVVDRYLNDLIIKPLTSRRSKPKPTSVFKHFGKNRSSSPVVAARMNINDTEDGIQSAILHCKKSYNSPSQGSNVLSRSGSAPSPGTRISVDEEKRSSI